MLREIVEWRQTRSLFRELLSIVWLSLLVGAAFPCIVRAQDWEPPVPMPDDFDWVQLTSGEWLKGQIRVMYQDSMEFDSEELDLQTFDLEDIKVIRSAQIINLRMRSGRTATGKLLLEDDQVTIIGDEQVTTTRDEILTITAGVQTERNFWTGDIVINGNFRTGNTEEVDTGVDVRFQRRTVISRIRLEFESDFNQINGVQTVDSQSGHISWDRFRSETIFLRPFFVDYFSDPFQNIESRYTMGVGVGYQLRDTPSLDWNVFMGPAYQETKFTEVEAGDTDTEAAAALTSGTVLEIELTSRIDLIADYRFQFAKEEAGGYSHRMTSTLSIDLTDSLDFDISAEWNRTQYPKPNADGTLPEQDDYRLSFGIGYEF